MKFYHKPVLVKEVLQWLDPKPNKVYVDATFGGGGHTRAILLKEPNCSVIAIDWDQNALEKNGPKLQEEFPGRLNFIWGNFSYLSKLLKKNGYSSVDGILADFGTSQFQIFELPGFSFSRDTFLDMRMSPSHQKITAAEVINKSSEEKLADIFFQLGEERFARRIARAIVENRKKRPITTTGQLADIIEHVVPRNPKIKIHPATRVFQALRIYVNNELDNIKSFLASSLSVLNPDGNLVCISFHSLEDRIVKQYFKDHECDHFQKKCLKILTPKAIEATQEEIEENPSSRSAKLRAAQFTEKS